MRVLCKSTRVETNTGHLFTIKSNKNNTPRLRKPFISRAISVSFRFSSRSLIDWCCFYYFVRNSLAALLEALYARSKLAKSSSDQIFIHIESFTVILWRCFRERRCIMIWATTHPPLEGIVQLNLFLYSHVFRSRKSRLSCDAEHPRTRHGDICRGVSTHTRVICSIRSLQKFVHVYKQLQYSLKSRSTIENTLII